jgi:hypothetical protein
MNKCRREDMKFSLKIVGAFKFWFEWELAIADTALKARTSFCVHLVCSGAERFFELQSVSDQTYRQKLKHKFNTEYKFP